MKAEACQESAGLPASRATMIYKPCIHTTVGRFLKNTLYSVRLRWLDKPSINLGPCQKPMHSVHMHWS